LLGRSPARRPPEGAAPPVATHLLDVDAGTAAPRRRTSCRSSRRGTSIRRKAWLPVLHTERGDWHFTALYSNTGRAHELRRTRDWVVIYFYDGDHRERQRTVVTETRGPLAGRRVVRGSEADCAGHYGLTEYLPAALSA
jgi:hypothetical protein